MRILAVETSCDETALALVECAGGLRAPKFLVRAELVASQASTHAPWGGVVPMLAKREHEKNLPHLYRTFSARELPRPDLIVVTAGPGLEPALWAGIEFANTLRGEVFPRVPLVGANHLEGHLASALLAPEAARRAAQQKLGEIFPAVALIVSGGHTILLSVSSLRSWKKLGETRDDAVGEAFDKVAKMLGLPYPGGPALEALAAEGDPAAVPFPRPMLHTKNFDFSFSGLKTAVRYHLASQGGRGLRKKVKADIAASFQAAAVEVLAAKAARALRETPGRSLLLSGGVAANTAVRTALARAAKETGALFFAPPMRFNTDNAVMIAAGAYLRKLRGGRGLPLRANGTLTI
jgi:N6-L-threonylcarbamoyladenine synthase